MIVNDCLDRVDGILKMMREQHDRIKASFRIEMEARRRKIKLQPISICRSSYTETLPSQFTTEAKFKSKDSTMINSRDPSNSMSPQLLAYESNESNKRVDTLNEIIEEGAEEQFSFEEIKLKGDNPLNKFKSPNPGWVTKSKQRQSVNHFDFEHDCGSFQHTQNEDQ